MKGSGKTIEKMEQECITFKTELGMKENGKMENLMEKEF